VRRIPAISFIGVSGSGKTTLLERLIPALARRGLRVAVVKHSHHVVLDDDLAGRKDTARFVAAGAVSVTGVAGDGTPDVFEAAREGLSGVNLILVEGWRALRLPTVEVIGADGARHDPAGFGARICVVTDGEIEAYEPVFARDDVERVAAFLVDAVEGDSGVA